MALGVVESAREAPLIPEDGWVDVVFSYDFLFFLMGADAPLGKCNGSAPVETDALCQDALVVRLGLDHSPRQTERSD